MSCVNSALWYVEFEKMGNLEKMLKEGTDLGVGMVIRDSICQRLTVCDHLHSEGMIQLSFEVHDNLLLCGCWISLIKTSLASIPHNVSPFGLQ